MLHACPLLLGAMETLELELGHLIWVRTPERHWQVWSLALSHQGSLCFLLVHTNPGNQCYLGREMPKRRKEMRNALFHTTLCPDEGKEWQAYAPATQRHLTCRAAVFDRDRNGSLAWRQVLTRQLLTRVSEWMVEEFCRKTDSVIIPLWFPIRTEYQQDVKRANLTVTRPGF